MSERVTITLPRYHVEATAELDRARAPRATSAFADVLPFQGRTLHARWCGNEIWTPVPMLQLESGENLTILPVPGEVLLVDHGGRWDLAIFYDRGWLFGPTGFLPATVIARIKPEDLAAFAVAANRVLIDGESDLHITRCVD